MVDPPVNIYWQPGELDLADGADVRLFFANIVDTDGWSLRRVEAAMIDLGYPDMVGDLRAAIDRFRRGEFDEAIRASGFDQAFCHRILGETVSTMRSVA